MNNKIFLILKKELREVFRDKKSLAMMLIIPIMIPLIVIGISYLFEAESNKDIKEYNQIGFTYKLNNDEKRLLKELKVDYKEGDTKKIKKLYKDEKIKIYIDKEDNNYIVNYNEDNVEAVQTIALAEKYLQNYKAMLQHKFLTNNNINSNDVLNIINVKYNTLKEKKNNFYSNYINTYAFLFIIMAITISATYPATDTTAGEKERGTMETLLTFPINNKDIIIGKYLSVSISSTITGLLGLILSLLSFTYIHSYIKMYKSMSLMPSLSTIVITILIIISYSFLISGLCIAIASLSKTFKEAQSSLTPITFISFFPGMLSFMLNFKTNFVMSIIPFLNYVQIYNDISNGNISAINIIAMFISTIIYIALVLNHIIKQYGDEKVLFHA